MSQKKIGGHRAWLGDIVQNIANIGVLSSFSEGGLGRVLQNKFQSFQLILPNLVLLYNFCQGTMRSFKNYNFTFMRRRTAHCKTGE